MFTVTKAEVGLVTTQAVKTWTDVVPLLRIEKNIRRMTIKEDGKFVLLVKNPPYERILHDSLPNLPGLCVSKANQ
jgi:hypothetical protein